MFKIIFLLKRKDGITHEQFRAHYESSHAEIAKRLIGHLLTRYVRNYVGDVYANPSEGGGAPHAFEYDVITEMEMKDAAAFAEIQRLMAEPETNAMLIADEEKFVDRKRILVMTCDPVDDGLVPR